MLYGLSIENIFIKLNLMNVEMKYDHRKYQICNESNDKYVTLCGEQRNIRNWMIIISKFLEKL